MIKADAEKKRQQIKAKVYNYEWRKLRKQKLALNPFCECEDCKQLKFPPIANEVHHIQDISVRPDLKYEMSNLMSMTKECHSRITLSRVKERK